MASATIVQPQGPTYSLRFRPTSQRNAEDLQLDSQILRDPSDFSALEWAFILKPGFQALHSTTPTSIPPVVLQYGLRAPRRKHADQGRNQLAFEIAGFLYPAPSEAQLPQIIKYSMSTWTVCSMGGSLHVAYLWAPCPFGKAFSRFTNLHFIHSLPTKE